MHVIAALPRNAKAAGGVRRRAPRCAARCRPRRAALAAVLTLLVLLLLAVEAQAYVPGQLMWAKRIGTSTSEAGAWTVAAGPNGATAIAGWKMVPVTGQMPMVARYTAGGAKWVKTYTSPGYADAVAFDRAGNVYVAMTVDPGSGGDIVVAKYSAAGVFLWATTPYDGGVGGADSARAIAVDRSGNVIVAGTSVAVPGTPQGIVVFKYDVGGAMMWPSAGRFDPPSGDPDAGPSYVDDLALDASGDIYVAGASEYRSSGVWVDSALVVKFTTADGVRTQGFVYEPAHNTSSWFGGLTVRGGTVIGVGETWDPADAKPEDGLIVRLDLSLAQKYRKEWGAGNKTGEWFGDTVIDGKGNVFVTGDQWLDSPSGYDKAVTMKLNPTLSKVLWKATYLPATRGAEGWYIARDSSGNIYVAGEKEDSRGNDDLLTIKYSPTGKRQWLKTWSAGGPDDDEVNGLVLGTKGGVYVGGQVTGKGDIYQAALLRYRR
jgi:hypothetical protein